MSKANSPFFFEIDSEYQEALESRSWSDNPEQRLVWAVIERSVRDALSLRPSDRAKALDWFCKKEVSTPEIFSFQWCCENLDIEPSDIRNKISRVNLGKV